MVPCNHKSDTVDVYLSRIMQNKIPESISKTCLIPNHSKAKKSKNAMTAVLGIKLLPQISLFMLSGGMYLVLLL